MLNAIVTIRASLKRAEKCCHNFDVPKEVWQQMGNTSIYNTVNDSDVLMDIDIPDK